MNKQAPVPLEPTFEPQRVLLVLPNWVGDVVMATPLLCAIFKRFAGAQISLLMRKPIADVLAGSPWMTHCYLWTKGKYQRRALVAELKAQAFDLAVILPNSFSSAWLVWRIRAKRRVGYARDGRAWLLTDGLCPPNKLANSLTSTYEPLPLVDYYAYLAAFLGCEPPGDRLTLSTHPAEEHSVSERLRGAGAGLDRPMVVICPGASFGAAKCWFPERFAAVADRLVERFGVTIVISPGPGEEALAHAIREAMTRPGVLLDEPCLTLGELKSLIRRSVLLLGNDTGPRHFARAFDVARVTVFGPTEARWTHTSHDNESIVRVAVPCGPCHKKVCPLAVRECMERVTVDMVADACHRALAEAGC